MISPTATRGPVIEKTANPYEWQVLVGGIMGKETSNSLVNDLDREHNFVLQRVQKFAEAAMADSTRLPMHCFYETKKTEILRRVLSSELAAKLSTRFTHKIVRLPPLPS